MTFAAEEEASHDVALPDEPASRGRLRSWVGGVFAPPYRVPWRPMFAVFFVALVLRAVFVAGVLEVQSDLSIWALYGDSPEYLRLANSVADLNTYTRDDLDSQIVGLVRTPLYPAVIGGWLKVAHAAGWSDKWAYGATFASQAVADSVLCALAGLLAWMVWRQRLLVWLVGLILAVSMTGIGLSATVMTDGPFAFWVGVSSALTLWAASRRSVWPAVLAGLAWSAATYTKPTTVLWPAGLPAMWVLASLGWEVSWKTSLRNLAVCGGLLVVLVFAWCVHNKVTTGVFAFSIVSERNLRYMVGPRIDEWREYGIFPEGRRLKRRYKAVGYEDRGWMLEQGMTPAEFVRRQKAQNWEKVWSQPGWFWRVWCDNFDYNMAAAWDVLDVQLPTADDKAFGEGGFGPQAVWTQPLRQVYFPLVWLDRQKEVTWTAIAMMCSAVPAAWAASLFPRRGRRERVRWAGRASALLVPAAYLLLTAATTTDQGSRILYPYQPLALAVAAGWLALLLPPYRVADVADENRADAPPAASGG